MTKAPNAARRALTAGLLAIAATCFVAVACGNTTAGTPVDVTLQLESLSDGAALTPRGWQVTLSEAVVLLGPIYAYAPRDEMASRLFGPPIARAHGGFDPLGGRIVRAEYLEQVAFDALSTEPLAVGEIFALEGSIDEVSVVLDAPRGDASATRGHHLFVAGTATREGVTVTFEGGLDLEDEGLTRRVDGVAANGRLADGAALVLGVDASAWLAEADFEGLPSEGVAQLSEETQPYRAWRLGARSAAAYAARTVGGEM